MSKLFTKVLCFIFISTSIQVVASPSSPLPTMTGQPYFENCEGLLIALSNEDIEKFFIGQVHSNEQALQLMADFGLIYTDEFRLALIKTLDDRGVHVPTIEVTNQSQFPKELQTLMQQILAITEIPEPDFKKFVLDTLTNYKSIAVANSTNDSAGLLRSHIQTRFIAAVEEIENDYVMPTYNNFVRAALLATARDLLEAQIRAKKSDWAFIAEPLSVLVLSGILITMTTAAPWIIQNHLHPSPPHLPGFRKFESFLSLMRMMKLLGWIGAGIGGLPIVFFIPSKAIFVKKQRQFSRRIAKQNAEAKFEVITDRGLRLEQTKSLLRDQAQTLQGLVVSLSDFEQTSALQNWSPVQLAYLGHLEMIEAKERGEFINAYFDRPEAGLELTHRLSDLQKMASALRAQPDQIRLRIELQKNLFLLTKDFEIAELDIRETVGALSRRILGIQAQIRSLREFFASQNSSSLTSKHQLILAKLQTDLATWDKAVVGENAILDRLSPIRTHLGQLKILAAREVTDAAETRDMASEILMVLEPFGVREVSP
jgi:hypothetical protein